MAKAKTINKKKSAPITDQIAIVTVQDRYSTYPSKGLTPEKLASLLREADGGDIYRQMELFEEMLEKDGHLQAIFQARKLAVVRRNYTIIPASDDKLDSDIANAVDEMVKQIKGWKNSLADILDSVPKGFSVNEIFWNPDENQLSVQRLRWVHQKKFRFGKLSDIDADPEDLRIVVDPRHIDQFRGVVPDSELAKATTDGISVESDPRLRQRFVVAYCKARSGDPARTSLMRTLTYLFLFKNYDVKWWVQFAEVLLGYRVGKYDPAQSDQKALLIKALAGLATDSYAVISKDSEIEFVEMAQKATTHQTYSELAKWCNDEMTKVVLGHTGAAEGTPGKLGEEATAREVKQELVEADAQVVDEAISDDLIRPFVDYNFGPQDEYPYYQTDLSPALDLLKEVQIDQGLQQMGWDPTEDYIKEKYGRPIAGPTDKVLTPRAPASSLFPAKSSVLVGDGKKKLLTSR